MSWKPSDPKRLEPITSGELHDAFMAGRRARKSLASEDTTVRLLWGVDWNQDFCNPTAGSLFVPGALEALARFIQFAYDMIAVITAVTASQDLHLIYMMFFLSLWEDEDGNPPPPFTVITAADIKAGKWRPTYDPAWQLKYVFKLEGKRKNLRIWPFHCPEGAFGSEYMPAWVEFMWYWAGYRSAQPNFVGKGRFWGSEMYAPQKALVAHPDDPNSVNHRLYQEVEEADEIFAGGVAENFCLEEWFNANIEEFGPGTGKEHHLLKFRTSRQWTAPIQFEGYEDALAETYAHYVRNGMLVTDADQYLDRWTQKLQQGNAADLDAWLKTLKDHQQKIAGLHL